MASEVRHPGQRLRALFATGAAFFFLLMPGVLGSEGVVAGVPWAYLGPFLGWALLIAASWLASRGLGSGGDDAGGPAP